MDNIITLEHFTQISYGAYGCCDCGAPLEGDIHYVGRTDDDEGYYWRGFCNRCASEIGLTSDHKHTQEQLNVIYQVYDASKEI